MQRHGTMPLLAKKQNYFNIYSDKNKKEAFKDNSFTAAATKLHLDQNPFQTSKSKFTSIVNKNSFTSPNSSLTNSPQNENTLIFNTEEANMTNSNTTNDNPQTKTVDNTNTNLKNNTPEPEFQEININSPRQNISNLIKNPIINFDFPFKLQEETVKYMQNYIQNYSQ